MPLRCIHCPNEFENSWHLFVSCNFAQSCWKHAGLDEVVNRLALDADLFTTTGWLFAVIRSVKEPILGKIMIILWYLEGYIGMNVCGIILSYMVLNI